MARIEGVLLDIDGTLLDSNDAHARAWADALAEFGVRADLRELRSLIGMGGDKLLLRYGIEKSSSRGRSLSEKRSRIFLERYLPKLEPFAGTRALLEKMKGSNLRRIAATSATSQEVKALLERAGVADLIEAATTSSDVEASKPDPDIVLAAIARSKLPREVLVMIGDTPYDVEAGRAAKVPVLAFRTGGWTDAQLAGAARVYQDPRDLLARWDTSPFAS